MKRPENIAEYKKWLQETHNILIDQRYENYYDSVVRKLESDIIISKFWTYLTSILPRLDQQYQIDTGYDLFLNKDTPEINIKSFSSFLLKTYRKNIIYNRKWPNIPKNGWLLPNNWFESVNDTIRTLVAVKYLDGVDFFTSAIEKFAKENNYKFRKFYEAREEGYYAVHIYIKDEFEIPCETWDTKRIALSFEIQVTTQLQEVIRKLLHTYYEKNRLKSSSNKEKNWQWRYRDDEFFANNLGQILHFVEGMILDIRDKQGEK